MLQEELKRDTPEFGGFDRAHLSVCLLCCLLFILLGGLDFKKKKFNKIPTIFFFRRIKNWLLFFVLKAEKHKLEKLKLCFT